MNARRFQIHRYLMREEEQPKRPLATALGYEPERDEAPQVLASGSGRIAERILELAQKHHVPVVEDPFLAEALSLVDVGSYIPPELYTVVAEVLIYVYRLRGHLPEILRQSPGSVRSE